MCNTYIQTFPIVCKKIKDNMAGITLIQAEARLTDYLNAEAAVLAGQSYSIAGRQVTKADLREIREGIHYWEAKVKGLARGGLKIKFGTPI